MQGRIFLIQAEVLLILFKGLSIMFEQEAQLNDPLLNGSQNQVAIEDDVIKAMNQPLPDTMSCPICLKEKPYSQFYMISEECSSLDHKFCMGCLSEELKRCIELNQDMYCLIDYCPQKMQENSKFFYSITKQLHDQYIFWKSSERYQHRNESARLTEHDRSILRIQGSQPIQIVEINEQIQPPVNRIINKTDVEIDTSDLNQFIREKLKRNNAPNQRRRSLQRHDQERMAGAPINNNIIRSYNCSRALAKLIMVTIGYPLLLLGGIIFSLITILFYLMIFLGAFSMVVSIAACIFIILKQEKYSYYLAGGCLVWFILALGWVRCCWQTRQAIDFLIIRNMWIWWRKKGAGIWYYPNKLQA